MTVVVNDLAIVKKWHPVCFSRTFGVYFLGCFNVGLYVELDSYESDIIYIALLGSYCSYASHISCMLELLIWNIDEDIELFHLRMCLNTGPNMLNIINQ